MAIVLSTEPRRVISIVGGGLVVAVALWSVHLNAAGLAGLLAVVAALFTGGLALAFGLSVIVEGRLDARARTQMTERLRADRFRPVISGGRCELCRRPLVMVAGVSLCATCDQRPEL